MPKVTRALEELPGVEEVVVRFPGRRAEVLYHPDEISLQRMCSHMAESGYKAEPTADSEHPQRILEPGHGDVVCYCFGYTRSDIEEDFRRHARSTIAERIASSKKQGMCQCKEKNPRAR
ncbi:MAG: hypothetical protein HY788_21970 [Deltaproteobacteria bacterium]|nr:hypothetical protein [Deltaproteobacteria bacterium]